MKQIKLLYLLCFLFEGRDINRNRWISKNKISNIFDVKLNKKEKKACSFSEKKRKTSRKMIVLIVFFLHIIIFSFSFFTFGCTDEKNMFDNMPYIPSS